MTAEQLIQHARETKATFLDLGNCGLTELPDLSGLESVRTLILGSIYGNTGTLVVKESQNKGKNNQISSLKGIEVIEQVENLHLWGIGLIDISHLKHLSNLTNLEFGYNQVNGISPLKNLNCLLNLGFTSNQVNDISSLKNLNNLQLLAFGKNQVSDISPLRNLNKLQYLDFWGNQVINISPLKNLSNLQNLYFSSNEVIDISPLKSLSNLQNLDFNSNQVSDISPLKSLSNLQNLDFNSNQVSDISHVKNRNNLQHLSFRSNKVRDISPLKNLSNLQNLYFSSNEVIDISPLKNLSNLQKLDFNSNQVIEISPLKNLNNLQNLDFSYNQVSDISFAFLQSFPILGELRLGNNPLTKIPTEISNQWECLESLTTYFQDLEKGSQPNNEVKIVLIGNGSVGKTQVATRLQEQEKYVFAEDHDSTHAIKLLRRELACDFLPFPLQLNIWDFGGQDIYHAAHQLFLQTRALFLLVWDRENETNPSHLWEGTVYKNEKLDYWLKYSEYFSQKSPVLVIQNKVDSEQEADAIALPQVTQNAFKKRFPHIVDFIQLSAKTGYAFELLEYLLQEGFEENVQLRNDLINKPLPAPWVRLRNKIRVEQAKTDGLKMLRKETFQAWCEAELIPTSTETLLHFFHESGVFYYNKKYFSGQIILDQIWAIAAVYKVLDKGKPYYKLLKQRKGKLTYKDICRIWKENTDKERELFLDFMLSCELSFETTESKEYDTPLSERTFVVPQLLSEQKPSEVEEYVIADGLAQQKTQEYLFLPPSLIQRFIIKAHAFAEIADMWQNGILLQYGNAAVVVEAVYGVESHIVTRYNAAAEQEFLAVIWEELEKLEKGENCMGSEHYRKGEGEFDARKFGFARLCAKNIPIYSTHSNRMNIISSIIEKIDNNDLSGAFEEIDKLGVSDADYAKLKQTFIRAKDDVDFIDRLKVYVNNLRLPDNSLEREEYKRTVK